MIPRCLACSLERMTKASVTGGATGLFPRNTLSWTSGLERIADFLSVQLPCNFPLPLPLFDEGVSPQFLQYVRHELETMPSYCTSHQFSDLLHASPPRTPSSTVSVPFLLPRLKQEGKRTRIPHLLVLFPSSLWNLSVLQVTPLASFKSFEKNIT